MNAQFWNSRYNEEGFAYGENPNEFLVSFINANFNDKSTNQSKKVLCIADGEGRNSIFLAQQGFQVSAMDYSEIGMKKLSNWATRLGLQVNTEVADLNTYDFHKNEGKWDIIVSIFAHLPPMIRQKVHSTIVEVLAPEGYLVYEAYHPDNIGRGTGGPQVVELCPTKDVLLQEVAGLTPIHINEVEKEVNEGKFHSGLAKTVEFVGKK